MIGWETVELVLRGWFEDRRRLRVRIKSERLDGTFLCKLRSVGEHEIVLFSDEGNPLFELNCLLDGCFFEFADAPTEVREEMSDFESGVFITGLIDLAIVVLQDDQAH